MADDRLNNWLSGWCTTSDVTFTNQRLVDFSSIFFDVEMNKLHCYLPPLIKKLSKKNKDKNIISDSEKKNTGSRAKIVKTKVLIKSDSCVRMKNERQSSGIKLRMVLRYHMVVKDIWIFTISSFVLSIVNSKSHIRY